MCQKNTRCKPENVESQWNLKEMILSVKNMASNLLFKEDAGKVIWMLPTDPPRDMSWQAWKNKCYLLSKGQEYYCRTYDIKSECFRGSYSYCIQSINIHEWYSWKCVIGLFWKFSTNVMSSYNSYLVVLGATLLTCPTL